MRCRGKRQAAPLIRVTCGENGQLRCAGFCQRSRSHRRVRVVDRIKGAAENAETLDKGVKTLAAAYPRAEVARYFWALLWQDPETWGGLKGRPELALE